jgi:hypothetical protein
MNEYKAYKNLVKHKRKINRVFSEICKKVLPLSPPMPFYENAMRCCG